MATYILIGTYTDQGLRQIREAPKRLDAGKTVLREMGGEIKSFYLTMGGHDFVMIYDAPDDAVATRFVLMLGMAGNVRTETLRAFPEAAYREIINSIGG